MDRSGGQTLEKDSPSLFSASPDLYQQWTETVHSRGVKGWLVETKTGRGQICHSQDDRLRSPTLAFRAGILMSAYGFAAMDDPEGSAHFSEDLHRVVQAAVIVMYEQSGILYLECISPTYTTRSILITGDHVLLQLACLFN